MARHRLPTELLERSGAFDHDPQRREARENEPVPSGPLGDPPEYFSAAQKAIWHELAEQVPEGVLTIADRILVEITSGLIERLRYRRSADQEDAEHLAPLKAAEYNLLISCLARMGLTPSDRSKIAAKAKPRAEADDTFGRLAASGRGSNLEQ